MSSELDASPTGIIQLISAKTITRRHDFLLEDSHWPDHAALVTHDQIGYWIDVNHRCNTQLWAQEDLARRTRVPDAEIVANKRAIDRYNQQRNDAIEKLDELLLLALGWLRPTEAVGAALQVTLPHGARLNSETIGGMIDRLSILALKIKAVGQLVHDTVAASDVHHAHALKLQRLLEQRVDLSFCLEALWTDSVAGRACFKVYRQFKLYNDPKTSPALMAESNRGCSEPLSSEIDCDQ